jgi:hypothetical protein
VPVVLEATRRQSEGEMTATERPVLALCVALASCRETPLTLEDRDAGDPEVQGFMQLADRPDRVLEAFSRLPTSGSISLAKPNPFRSRELGWERIVFSAHIQSYEQSRACYFARGRRELPLVCETETLHSHNRVSSPNIDQGRPFWAYIQITYGTELPKQKASWAVGV